MPRTADNISSGNQFQELISNLKNANLKKENFGEMRTLLEQSVSGFSQSEKAFRKLDIIADKFKEQTGKSDSPIVETLQDNIEKLRSLDGSDRKEQMRGLRSIEGMESILKEIKAGNDEEAKKNAPLLEEQISLLKQGIKAQSSVVTKTQKLFTDKIEDLAGTVAGIFGNSPIVGYVTKFISSQLKDFMTRRAQAKKQETIMKHQILQSEFANKAEVANSEVSESNAKREEAEEKQEKVSDAVAKQIHDLSDESKDMAQSLKNIENDSARSIAIQERISDTAEETRREAARMKKKEKLSSKKGLAKTRLEEEKDNGLSDMLSGGLLVWLLDRRKKIFASIAKIGSALLLLVNPKTWITAFTKGFAGLKSSFGNILKAAASIFSFKNLSMLVKGLLKGTVVLGLIWGLVEGLFDGITNAWKDYQKNGDFLGAVGKLISGTIGGFLESVSFGLIDGNEIASKIDSFFGDLTGVFDTIGDAVSELYHSITNWVKTNFNSLKNWIVGLNPITAIENFLSGSDSGQETLNGKSPNEMNPDRLNPPSPSAQPMNHRATPKVTNEAGDRVIEEKRKAEMIECLCQEKEVAINFRAKQIDNLGNKVQEMKKEEREALTPPPVPAPTINVPKGNNVGGDSTIIPLPIEINNPDYSPQKQALAGAL